MFGACSLLTTPSDETGLDKRVVGKMHYYQGSKGNWYYNDRAKPVSTWYYDYVTMPKGNGPDMVKEMQVNMENEE